MLQEKINLQQEISLQISNLYSTADLMEINFSLKTQN